MASTADTPFALGSFSVADGPPFAALVIADRILGVTALTNVSRDPGVAITGATTVLTILENWVENFPRLQCAANELGRGRLAGFFNERSIPIGEMRSHPPVQPRQILCTAGNYRKHVIQMESAYQTMTPDEAARMIDEIAANGKPYLWPKLPSAVTGPYEQVELPGTTTMLDWELELAVILGRAARHVTAENALSCVAGYCIANDLSARDLIRRPDLKQIGTDWLRAKSGPGFLPLGPHFVPAQFVSDPHNLRMVLKHNGKVMQDESTADMIHRIPKLIEYASRHVQLWPGDVICTGSPAGNGMHFGVFLKAGDTVEGSITGLGQIRNTFIEERGREGSV